MLKSVFTLSALYRLSFILLSGCLNLLNGFWFRAAHSAEAVGERLQQVDFFIVAHPDDWQLFMNPDAYYSVKRAAKSVFIHLSAGEAGRIESSSYYLAREQGALRALGFLLNVEQQVLPAWQATTLKLQNHSLQRYAIAQSVAYFFRLPDGDVKGKGFKALHKQSLLRFRHQKIPELRAVDHSTVYRSWEDLVRTLSELVRQERAGQSRLIFHLADPDLQRNPEEHSDHQQVSLLAQEVARQMPCIEQKLYLTYSSDRHPPNLTAQELLIDAGTWAATTSVLAEAGFASTWDQAHTAWLGRNYFRSLPARGRCSF